MRITLPIHLSLLSAQLCLSHVAEAADLVLLHEGKSNYQIVVPDSAETELLTECLNQTARLVQTAFAANGAEVPVVRESDRDPEKPALFLGNTEFGTVDPIHRIVAERDRWRERGFEFGIHPPEFASIVPPASRIPGAMLPEQVSANIELMRHDIPADLWAELKNDGLIREDAPTPQG